MQSLTGFNFKDTFTNILAVLFVAVQSPAVAQQPLFSTPWFIAVGQALIPAVAMYFIGKPAPAPTAPKQ